MNDLSLLSAYLLSGVCIYSVLHHLTYALNPPRSRDHLLFAAMCLIGLFLNGIQIEAFQATSVADFVFKYKLTLAAHILFYGWYIWFIAEFTKVRPRKLILAISFSFCVLFVLNLAMPYGLQFRAVEALRPVQAPSGRTFVQAIGELSPYYLYYVAHVPFVFAFFIFALTRNYRASRKTTTVVILGAVVIQMLTAIESIFVRAGLLDFTNLGPFGFLVVITVIGAVLSHETLVRLRDSETRLKEQVSESQKLYEQAKTVNRLKDEFLAMISHELRTPLNVIIGHGDLLTSGDLSNAESLQSIEAIVRNAKLQSSIVDSLLDVSGIISGKLHLNITQVNLKQVIQSAVESVKASTDAKGIAVHTDLEASVGFVSGDIDRLRQVIWNLLSNAVKFTPTGGSIFIQLKRIGSAAQVMVRDTGIGIDPEFQPYLFDRFRQEDGSLTRKFGGLGLGLAIARHIIESHGGSIEASSQGKGKGATFQFSLPLMSAVMVDSNLP
jgi:signal transduction histidine kinase